MEDSEWLAERFEAARPRLQRIAQRTLGSATESDDALQAGIDGADAVARTFSGRANAAQPVFIDGNPGAVWMHAGEVRVAFRFRITDERITAIDLIADPTAIAQSVIER